MNRRAPRTVKPKRFRFPTKLSHHTVSSIQYYCYVLYFHVECKVPRTIVGQPLIGWSDCPWNGTSIPLHHAIHIAPALPIHVDYINIISSTAYKHLSNCYIITPTFPLILLYPKPLSPGRMIPCKSPKPPTATSSKAQQPD